MLRPGCPHCSGIVIELPDEREGAVDERWSCPLHGPVPALWRTDAATYDDFAAHLDRAGRFPTYVPWPMAAGWQISDFAVVLDGRGPRGTVTGCSGTSALDGPVDVLVVAEEPGTGLGGRVARLHDADPVGLGEGPAVIRVRIDSASVPLWPVSTSSADEEFDRTVLAGEAFGRWLWIVLRPASAILLMRDEWILRDVSGVGPTLVDMEFGGPLPPW